MTITDFLARSPLPAFGDPRDGLPRDLVTPFSAFDLDVSAPFLVCVHKGFIERTPPPFLRLAMGASRVVHADSVFVVFEVAPGEGADNDIRAYRVGARGTVGEKAPMPVAHPAPRFMCYMGNGTVLTETRFGRRIYLDGGDLSLTPHILRDGIWEPWMMRHIERVVGPGQTFLDIGANCGFHTLLAAHLVGQGGRVVAVEPMARQADLIRRSLAINGFDGFCAVVQAAVGERPETRPFYRHADYHGSSGFELPGDHAHEAVEMPLRPLPALLADLPDGPPDRIDFIKLDIEGFEYCAWTGMREMLAGLGPHRMAIEFTPDRYREQGHDPARFLAELAQDGYTLERLCHDGEAEALDPATVEDGMAPGGYVDILASR